MAIKNLLFFFARVNKLKNLVHRIMSATKPDAVISTSKKPAMVGMMGASSPGGGGGGVDPYAIIFALTLTAVIAIVGGIIHYLTSDGIDLVIDAAKLSELVAQAWAQLPPGTDPMNIIVVSEMDTIERPDGSIQYNLRIRFFTKQYNEQILEVVKVLEPRAIMKPKTSVCYLIGVLSSKNVYNLLKKKNVD